MKTRSTEMVDGSDPFANLQPAKPVDIPNINSMLKASEASVAKKEVKVETSEKNALDLTVHTASNRGPEWIRQQLTSLCVPYDFNEAFMKPVDIPVLSMIHSSSVNQSFTLLIDALDQCFSEDIRQLTPQDFTFAMYWIRDNSYPQSPMRIEYETRYGNTQTINLRQSDLTIKELDLTREEYLRDWKSKGIVFPTMRDAELISKNADIPADLQWMLEYAQYVEYIPGVDKDGNTITDYSDYVERKFEKLKAMGPSAVVDIRKFIKLIDHGVTETITIVDRAFDPIKAAEYFETEAKKVINTLNTVPEENIDDAFGNIMNLAKQANEWLAEAKELRRAVAAGETVEAKKEVRPVEITATDFFPEV